MTHTKTVLFNGIILLMCISVAGPAFCAAVTEPAGVILWLKGQRPESSFVIKRAGQILPPSGVKTTVFLDDIIEPANDVVLEYVPAGGKCTRVTVSGPIKIGSGCAPLENKGDSWTIIERITGTSMLTEPHYRNSVTRRSDEGISKFLHVLLLKPVTVFVNAQAAPDALQQLAKELQRPGVLLTQKKEEADLIVNLAKITAASGAVELKATLGLAKKDGAAELPSHSYNLNSELEKTHFEVLLERSLAYIGISSLCDSSSYAARCRQGKQAPIAMKITVAATAGKQTQAAINKAESKAPPRQPQVNRGELTSVDIEPSDELQIVFENTSDADYYVYLIGIRPDGRVFLRFEMDNGQVNHPLLKKGEQTVPNYFSISLPKDLKPGAPIETMLLLASPQPLVINQYLSKSMLPEATELLERNFQDPQTLYPYLMLEEVFVSGVTLVKSK